ncbi:MAG: hypothetical protein LBB25_01785 [Holosporaceae bacterium]|jgi:hypothetical protein|nr:hypothetical protein [Holosporaceae bacterium]
MIRVLKDNVRSVLVGVCCVLYLFTSGFYSYGMIKKKEFKDITNMRKNSICDIRSHIPDKVELTRLRELFERGDFVSNVENAPEFVIGSKETWSRPLLFITSEFYDAYNEFNLLKLRAVLKRLNTFVQLTTKDSRFNTEDFTHDLYKQSFDLYYYCGVVVGDALDIEINRGSKKSRNWPLYMALYLDKILFNSGKYGSAEEYSSDNLLQYYTMRTRRRFDTPSGKIIMDGILRIIEMD